MLFLDHKYLKIKKLQQETRVCAPQYHTYPNTWLQCIGLVIPQHQPTLEVNNGLNIILLEHHLASGFQREWFPEEFEAVSSCHDNSGAYSSHKTHIFNNVYTNEQKPSLAVSFNIAPVYQLIQKYLSN
jgi:hypothetical protein